MSQRDDAVPMRHMLDHAREACELVVGRSRAEIHADRLLQLALTRLVEIVGEAAGRVSRETQGSLRGRSVARGHYHATPDHARLRCRRLRHPVGYRAE